MSYTTYNLCCYIEGDNIPFNVVAPLTMNIHELKELIYNKRPEFFVGFNAWRLPLTKVNVPFGEVGGKITCREYQPNVNDQPQQLQTPEMIMSSISEVWCEPPPDNHLHIFVGQPAAQPCRMSNMTPFESVTYKAAKGLYEAMWGTNLDKRLLDVNNCEGFKYLPPAEVKNLQLRKLGCCVDVILVRNEYSFALETLESHRQNNHQGVVMTGQPGIGKSIFLFYLLLHLLSMREPVALQYNDNFYLFYENGIEMHSSEKTTWNFQIEGKLWTLSNSNSFSRQPCQSFQRFSQQKHAFIVQAAPPIEDQWEEWTKYCDAGLFIMEPFTENEAIALSIILNFNVKCVLGNFKKWGPNARTCTRLAQGTLVEGELQREAYRDAQRFTQNPLAVATHVLSDNLSYTLMAITPDDTRLGYTLTVTTPYLWGIIMQAIANLDPAKQASFYHSFRRASRSMIPTFRGMRIMRGCIFENYFLVWLYSAESACPLPCAPATTSPSRTKRVTRSMTFTADNQAKLTIQPLGREKLTVVDEDSGFANVEDCDTPFGWLPASRMFPSFGAIIFTDKNIITIQVTVSVKNHSMMKRDDFDRLKKCLPATFERARTWCHVFVTDRPKKATSLRSRSYNVDFERDISIYTAVLDVSKFSLTSEDVKRAFTPDSDDESLAMDTSGMSEEEQ